MSTHRFAGFWVRFLAWNADSLIISTIGITISLILGTNPFVPDQTNGSIADQIITLIIVVCYFVSFWAFFEGATPGKKLLGIRVVRTDGKPVSIIHAFVRYIGYFVSSFALMLGFLWIIWDKKKQGFHDKMADTLVVHTDKKPNYTVAIILLIIGICYFCGLFVYGFVTGFNQALEEQGTSMEELMYEAEHDDSARIGTYAPSPCGLTIPVPNSTDTTDGVSRKWLYEEVPGLDVRNFYILDKDVYPVATVTGVFLGYKDSTDKLDVSSQQFSIAYPGLNIMCAENERNLTLEEFRDLALTNKQYSVTAQDMVRWGEVDLYPMRIQGTGEDGIAIDESLYIATTPDRSRLMFIRVWAPDTADPEGITISEDTDIVLRNLRFREASNSRVLSETTVTYPLNFANLNDQTSPRAAWYPANP